jgi:phage baseplate assembly protein W
MSVSRSTEVRGLGLPIASGKGGEWPTRTSNALRKSSIINILGTYPGERVMLGSFGSRLPLLLMEPIDDLLLQRLREETVGALQRWDPLIKVIGVVPEIDNNMIRLFIDYIDLGSSTQEIRRTVLNLRNG